MPIKSDYKKYLVIEEWYGGLSDGSRTGIKGSFRYGQGLNYKDNIDSVTADLALVKDSSTTVVDLPLWFAYDPVQDDVYAYGNAGKLYKKATSTWALLRSVSDSDGEGLAVYDDYLYYRRNETIGRYGALSGAASATDAWKGAGDGVEADANYCPILTFQNFVAFGNGRYLATWDGATFTSDALTFSPGWYVRDLAIRGDYLAIAVNDSKNINRTTRGKIYYWDGISSQYNFINEINDGAGIGSLCGNQEVLYICPAHSGNIYMDTGRITKVKKVPFIEAGKTVQIQPGGTTFFKGLFTFGTGLGTSEEVYRGVYQYGQPSKDYPLSLNFSYPLSHGTVTGSNVDTGAVFSVGSQIYVGWKKDSTYGIDLLSTSVLQTAVTYQSRVLSLPKEAAFDRIKVYTEPLASGESIVVSYKADRTASWTELGTISYAVHGASTSEVLNVGVRATDFELQLALAGSTSSMPTVHKVIVEYNEEDRL